jgi:hypothetical protein
VDVSFCSTACKNSYEYRVGSRSLPFNPRESVYESWERNYSTEEVQARTNEWKSRISSAAKASDSRAQKKAAAASITAWNKSCSGKTLEEIHGSKKAKIIRENLSVGRRGSKNPAYGKCYKRGGRSIKGYYKGIFFRSLLEYSYLKHIESQGIDVTDTSQLQVEAIRLEWEEGRTYVIDFYLPELKIAVEIKPQYLHSDNTVMAKSIAAKKYCRSLGIEYQMLGENEFTKLDLESSIDDKDTVWDTRTFKYFKMSSKIQKTLGDGESTSHLVSLAQNKNTQSNKS